MSDDSGDNWSLGVAIAGFAAVGVMMVADIVWDTTSGTSLGHMAVEIAVALVSLGAATLLALRLKQAAGEVRALAVDLSATRAEAERWRKEAHTLLQGLGEAIDKQFARWQFTPAERDVALLLLKGLSHKEVARVRKVSERTARQQSLAIYKKAGVEGRAELAAFFLEDLFLPLAQTPSAG
ncbi:MAG: response regulator transcription factor [Planctomycetes bacterium]|nr:response regulator transcription factor [Planctomycetota bacterium]